MILSNKIYNLIIYLFILHLKNKLIIYKNKMSQLDRFIKAQENDYQIALNEIKNGSKDSCWMWYIFPQIRGLGLTEMSKTYAIKDMEEAIEYLNNEILRTRLIEISQALLDLGDVEINKVMGFPDDLKLKSSMTLFREAEKESEIKCDNIFQKVLDQFFKGEEDPKTLVILQKQQYEKENGVEKKEEKEEEDNEKSTVKDIIEDYNKNKNIVLSEHMTDRNIKDTDKENIDTNAQEETNLENENEIKTPFGNKNNNTKDDNIQEKKKNETITSIMLDPNNDNLENKNNNNSLEKEDEEKCCPECLII